MTKKKRLRSLRCPICRKLVLRSDPEFPFCSERCRLIDLGKWASGKYVVSTPITEPEGEASQRISESDQGQPTERDGNHKR